MVSRIEVRKILAAVAAALWICAAAAPVRAQESEAAFYKGKTVRLFVGYRSRRRLRHLCPHDRALSCAGARRDGRRREPAGRRRHRRFPIYPMHPFVVHIFSAASQQYMQAPITESRLLSCQHPPAAVATLHRCACFDTGNWIPPPSADGRPAAG